MFPGSNPAWHNSACKYNRCWQFSALFRNVLMNFRPNSCNSPDPPPLFNIPTNSRNRTGSPQRSRSVDNASDTEIWPGTELASVWPWPKVARSQATVRSCRARIRDRMPWPVADAANGSRPTGEVPNRTPASVQRAVHRLRHWLQMRQ